MSKQQKKRERIKKKRRVLRRIQLGFWGIVLTGGICFFSYGLVSYLMEIRPQVLQAVREQGILSGLSGGGETEGLWNETGDTELLAENRVEPEAGTAEPMAGTAEPAAESAVSAAGEALSELVMEESDGAESDARSADAESAPEETLPASSEQWLEESGQEETEEQKAEEQIFSVVVGTTAFEVYGQVHMVAFGDNLCHRSVQMSGLQDDGSYNYSYNFAYVADTVAAADLAVINQEAVVGGNEIGIQGYPSFNCRTEMADQLAAVGFDVVLAANNHIMDWGSGALRHMIGYFESNYAGQIALAGIHSEESRQNELCIVERNGIRIAIINYTQIMNNKTDLASEPYLVEMLDYNRLAALIAEAKRQSDFVVVFPHWGTEYELGTDAAQQEQAAFLAEQKVDLVIGAHPHVVEPMSYVMRPDGVPMVIYYSLGNYQSIQHTEATVIGSMADVVIQKDSKGTHLVNADMSFLVTDYRFKYVKEVDYFDKVTTYFWSQFSPELLSTSGVYHDNPSFQADQFYALQSQMQEQVSQTRRELGYLE